MDNIGLITILLFGITFLAVLSNKLKIPFPIVLVLSGVAISLVPGLPVISLDPEIAFLIFLPPLLYAAAWNTSWHHFKSNTRPILYAAVGLVLITTFLVAVVAHALIPGISWPLGFLLGAIISPPDAVAATSITKGLGLQPRIVAVLEGESLLNDASGLIAYKFAITAVMSGNFIWWHAGANFLLVASAGIAIGLIIGYTMFLIHKNLVTDPIIEVTLTILTPFAAYLLAEHFHVSGVLAVVFAGLFLSFNSEKILTHQSRIMAYSVWEVIVFILNSLIFILIGLQLRSVIRGIGAYSCTELFIYGVVISVIVIIIRFISIVPFIIRPQWLGTRKKHPVRFDYRNVIVFGWAGMRGVVSMAAALSIPLLLPEGVDFPNRNLLIYLTFCVIIFTLLFLGPTLPWLIKKLGLMPYSIAAEEYQIRTTVVSETISHIEENFSFIKEGLLTNLKNKYEIKYNRLQRTELPAEYFSQENKKQTADNIFNEFSKLQLEILTAERQILSNLHSSGQANEEIWRKIERELDLEETQLRMQIHES